MSEENIQELMDYNLEYMEAQQSEEIFGGDYTSAIDLKYANKQIEKLEKAMEDKSSYKDIIIENQQKKINKQKAVLDKIKDELKEDNEYLENAQELYSQHDDELIKALAIQLINNNLVHNDNILKLLEERE